MVIRFTCTRCKGQGSIGEDQLQRVQSGVLRAVRGAKSGITIEKIVDKVYVGGAPDRAENSVQTAIRSLNRRSDGIKIIADKRGRGARYRLVENPNDVDRTVNRTIPGREPGCRAHVVCADREEE